MVAINISLFDEILLVEPIFQDLVNLQIQMDALLSFMGYLQEKKDLEVSAVTVNKFV